MGILDWFRERKSAKKLGLTVEQYREFRKYEASNHLSLQEYQTYLHEASGRMSLQQYVDQRGQKEAGQTRTAVPDAPVSLQKEEKKEAASVSKEEPSFAGNTEPKQGSESLSPKPEYSIYDQCWCMCKPPRCLEFSAADGWVLRSASETVLTIRRSEIFPDRNDKVVILRDDAQIKVRAFIPKEKNRSSLSAMVEVGSNKYSLQMQWNAQEIEENEAAFRYGLFMRTIGSIKLPGEREEGNYRFDKKQTLFSDIQISLPSGNQSRNQNELFNDGKIRVTCAERPIVKNETRVHGLSTLLNLPVLSLLSNMAWQENCFFSIDFTKFLIADASCSKKRLLIAEDIKNNRQMMLCVENIDPSCHQEKETAYFAHCLYETLESSSDNTAPIPLNLIRAPQRLSTYPSRRLGEKLLHAAMAERDKKASSSSNKKTSPVHLINMNPWSDIDLQFVPIRRALIAETPIQSMSDKQWEQAKWMGITTKTHLPYMDEAREYASLFRVNREVFDPQHDRENEILRGYVDNLQAFTSLRSFAYLWGELSASFPNQLLSVAVPILETLARFTDCYMPWSYSPGLCNAPTCYAAYVRNKHIQQLEEKNWKYFPLEVLQEDLLRLAPFMKEIYHLLSEDRDRSKALCTPLANVLYAWCSMALASQEPFVVLEGPSHCFFNWLGSDDASPEMSRSDAFCEAESIRLARMCSRETPSAQPPTSSDIIRNFKMEMASQDSELLQYAREHIDEDAIVTFEGKHFVLSGYESDIANETEAAIRARGGVMHSSMVKMADYLVLRLETFCGCSKLNKALEWRSKGSNVKIITDEMLRKALQ